MSILSNESNRLRSRRIVPASLAGSAGLAVKEAAATQKAEEEEIVRRTTVGVMPEARTVLNVEDLMAMQGLIRRLPANGDVVRYCVKLSGATRPGANAVATPRIIIGRSLIFAGDSLHRGKASKMKIGSQNLMAGASLRSREEVRGVCSHSKSRLWSSSEDNTQWYRETRERP